MSRPLEDIERVSAAERALPPSTFNVRYHPVVMRNQQLGDPHSHLPYRQDSHSGEVRHVESKI